MAARRRPVAWAESARDALDEVVAYIAEDSRDRAIQVLLRALATADSLVTLSERGRVVPELADPGMRELLVYQYRMIYRVLENEVVIEAFLHGARDFAMWRRDQPEM